MGKKKKKETDREIIERLLLMTQHFANAINLETAAILHNMGVCQTYIMPDEKGNNNCPICRIEKEEKEKKEAESEDNASD